MAEHEAAAAEDRYLSIEELVDYSGLSIRNLRRHLNAETSPIPHFKIGRRVLVRKLDFDRWIEKVGTPENVRRAQTMHEKVREAIGRFRGSR